MIKNILCKNKTLFATLKKIKISITLLKVYLLKIFDPIRVQKCSENTIRCEYNIKNKNYKYTLLGKDTPVGCLTHLYEITKDLTKLFNDKEIEYFIMYGTLLGQVRHNQTFIPWDTDVDIVVMSKDRQQVIELVNDKLSDIYDVIEFEKILKVNFSTTNNLHADIYFWDEEDGVLVDILNDYWVKNRVIKKDVFPLVFSKLYNLDVKVPQNSEKVLKTTYGDDCLEKAFKKYAYITETSSIFEFGKIDNEV